MAVHELKTWPEFFDAIATCKKSFELRKDDRGGFAVNDLLWLREWDPATKQYSGHEACRRVTYVLWHRPDAGCAATFGLQPGYVIMGIAWAPLAAIPSSHKGNEGPR